MLSPEMIRSSVTTRLKEDRFRLWIWTEGLISGFLPRSLVLNAQ
jgi:hypothetical protein